MLGCCNFFPAQAVFRFSAFSRINSTSLNRALLRGELWATPLLKRTVMPQLL
jgi:hypothetical protein